MLGYAYTGEAVRGWYASEKLDGQRAYWDGGVSVGILAKNIPWANCVKGGGDLVCSGFWSRYFKPLPFVPDSIRQELYDRDFRNVWLDGEFWGGPETFGKYRPVISRTVNPKPWPKELKYWVFDSPAPRKILQSRLVTCPGYKFRIPESAYSEWACITGNTYERAGFHQTYLQLQVENFGTAGARMEGGLYIPDPDISDMVGLVPQNEVSEVPEIILAGSEGWMLRHPYIPWLPTRSKNLLKVKTEIDFTASVIGWNPGKGKYAGKIGSLILMPHGDMATAGTFNCSGMPDEQREHGFWNLGDCVAVTCMGLTHLSHVRDPRVKGKIGDR